VIQPLDGPVDIWSQSKSFNTPSASCLSSLPPCRGGSIKGTLPTFIYTLTPHFHPYDPLPQFASLPATTSTRTTCLLHHCLQISQAISSPSFSGQRKVAAGGRVSLVDQNTYFWQTDRFLVDLKIYNYCKSGQVYQPFGNRFPGSLDFGIRIMCVIAPRTSPCIPGICLWLEVPHRQSAHQPAVNAQIVIAQHHTRLG
jgi:hypothetical protein